MIKRPLGLALLGLTISMGPTLGQTQDANPVAPAVAPLANANPDQAESSPLEPGVEYVLGPDDVIEIEVVGQPDKAQARVYADGTVQLNLVGKLTAAGKTSRELGADIAEALKAGGYYANPVVNVEIATYASRYVTVLGAVATPSLVPMNRRYRLSEILARVGGAQPSAADYLVVRSADGREERYLIDELATGDDTKDPYVSPGDKIFAPPAELFYVSGQVNAPGAFPLKSGLTVRQAIARAGGLTASGSDKKVTVNRDGKKVKLSPDEELRPNDVLVVGERLF